MLNAAILELVLAFKIGSSMVGMTSIVMKWCILLVTMSLLLVNQFSFSSHFNDSGLVEQLIIVAREYPQHVGHVAGPDVTGRGCVVDAVGLSEKNNAVFEPQMIKNLPYVCCGSTRELPA